MTGESSPCAPDRDALNPAARAAWRDYMAETDPEARAMLYRQYLDALLAVDELPASDGGA